MDNRNYCSSTFDNSSIASPKGDGIGGIGGASHVFASQKSAEKGLNKLTGIICAIFIFCTFLLGFGIVK